MEKCSFCRNESEDVHEAEIFFRKEGPPVPIKVGICFECFSKIAVSDETNYWGDNINGH